MQQFTRLGRTQRDEDARTRLVSYDSNELSSSTTISSHSGAAQQKQSSRGSLHCSNLPHTEGIEEYAKTDINKREEENTLENRESSKTEGEQQIDLMLCC